MRLRNHIRMGRNNLAVFQVMGALVVCWAVFPTPMRVNACALILSLQPCTFAAGDHHSSSGRGVHIPEWLVRWPPAGRRCIRFRQVQPWVSAIICVLLGW